jgi:hypothetical protein
MKYECFKKNINYEGPLHTILGTNCHLWTGIEKNGHGAYSKGMAHRLLWIHLNGKIPDGYLVRHKCDNGICVNIEHLELGTHKDNVNDMIQRGRAKHSNKKGENVGQSKLKVQQVLEIRENKDNLTHKQLSMKYNISQTQISRIRNNNQWLDTSQQLSKEQEFLNKANQGNYNDILKSHCLEMPKSRMIISFNNKSKLAHRIAWEIQYGSIPDKMHILHKCDNSKCINYLHLELGNHEKNMKDRQDRKRTASGIKHGMSKLTEENIRYIRNNPDKKMGIELSKQFGVSENCIIDIKKFRSYKDIQ